MRHTDERADHVENENILIEKMTELEDEVIILKKRNDYLTREIEIWKNSALQNQKAVKYWHDQYTEKTREMVRKIEKLKAKAEGVQTKIWK